MNPLAFEPTDMDIVALCDNVSCDVKPLVRLLIDMKSKHAGLFGELMPALETALSRNSTKLVDVISLESAATTHRGGCRGRGQPWMVGHRVRTCGAGDQD